MGRDYAGGGRSRLFTPRASFKCFNSSSSVAKSTPQTWQVRAPSCREGFGVAAIVAGTGIIGAVLAGLVVSTIVLANYSDRRHWVIGLLLDRCEIQDESVGRERR